MAFLRQYGRLLIILVKLKRWRFLFMAAVVAGLVSNHFLYYPMSTCMLRLGKTDMNIIGVNEFAMDNLVLIDREKYRDQFDTLAEYVSTRGTVPFDNSVRTCTLGTDCDSAFFKILAAQGHDKLVHYLDYKSDDGRPKLTCQVATGYELYCPYMAYLVAISQDSRRDIDFRYNQTRVFRLLENFKEASMSRENASSICTRDINYSSVFPGTLMAQMIFVAIALVFYLLVSTVSCIYELKSTGFLQLMYRRGLSVLAYWLALWTITLIEMAIFAAVLVLAHYLQCSQFYSQAQLINVFLLAFLHFCCLASLVFLFSVITRRANLVSLLSCILCTAIVAVLVISHIVLTESKEDDNSRRFTFAVPFAHLAEQLNAELRALTKRKAFFHIVTIISGGLLGATLLFTIYLDFVLKSGSGLRLPLTYLLYPRFWSMKFVKAEAVKDPPVTFMTEASPGDLDSVLRLSRLRKAYKNPGCCCSGTSRVVNISAQFHADQITAIVGNNGSGKSTLMQILWGERLATSGKATLNDQGITDPICRYHLRGKISYCPQENALVSRMTVCDAFKLAASSSHLAWDDVQVELESVLERLQMEDSLDEPIELLSSSDKRKVSMTLALIGQPRLMLLDDPMREMDYVSKRRMWRLLHERKRDRAIVFSTMYVDEAEGMADRLMFLCGGGIMCSGTTFFFKRVFDCNYIIQIASKTEFHVPILVRKVTTKFSCVRVRSISYADVEFEVPITEDEILPDVIAEIESMSAFIAEFGIANFRLDDVFSKMKDFSAEEILEHCKLSTIGYIADDNDRIQALTHRSKQALPGGPNDAKISRCVPSTVSAFMMATGMKIRWSKCSLLARVFVPVALLLLVTGAAFIEKLKKNNSVNIWYNLSNPVNFPQRGICLFYYSMSGTQFGHMDLIKDEECSWHLSGLNATTGKAQATRYLGQILTPTRSPLLERRIEDRIDGILPKIREHCKKTLAPCSIAYSSDWCPAERKVSETHVMHVGVYIRGTNYTAESIATNAIEVYKNLVRNLTNGVSKGSIRVNPSFDTIGCQGITSVFYYFYGLFAQMVLLAVMPIICFTDVMHDRSRGIKAQLLSMGMSRAYYWLCTLLAHWIQLAIVYLLSTLPLILLVSDGYKSEFYFAAVVPPTLTFGLVNSLMCVYALSLLVKRHDYYVSLIVYVYCSLLIAMSALLVQTSDLIGQIMIFLLPHYAIIAPAFYGVKLVFYANAFYRERPALSLLPLVVEPGRHRDSLMALLVHCLLLVLVLALLEVWDKRKTSCGCSRQDKYKAESEAYADCQELSIAQEISQLEAAPGSEANILEATNIKMVDPKGRLTLRNLTLAMKHGEVLGLLGPCGSGKTSAIRGIVGEQQPTAGRVDFHLQGKWLSGEAAAQRGFIGYCPKHDPIHESLTVRGNLHFYASAIGVSRERTQQVLRHFHLEQDVNTIAMRATAGVRRRLSMAIAVLPCPRFVAINQASAGVDPEGRKILWLAIESMASRQRGILVATQEMEEAEKLCSRICIMNGGLMAAINTVDELVFRYRKLYMLELQVSNECQNSSTMKADLVDRIMERFPGAIIIEQLSVRLEFAVPILSIGRLSNALKWLVQSKAPLGIVYFTFHFASIDQTMKAIVVHQNSREMMALEEDADEEIESTTIAV